MKRFVIEYSDKTGEFTLEVIVNEDTEISTTDNPDEILSSVTDFISSCWGDNEH